MPHGLPDGALSGKGVTIFHAFDVGELAARLGSIHVYNREGNVIFIDNFGQTLTGWTIDGSGVAPDVYPVVFPTMRGGIAIMLKTGALEEESASIRRYLHYPVGAGLGIEVGFIPVAELKYLSLGFLLFTDLDRFYMQCRYQHATGKLELRTGGATWSELATIGTQREGGGSFCSMKLVGDIIARKYVRVIFNSVEYDASAHSLYVATNGADRAVLMAIGAFASDAGSAEVVIDDVIVTINEIV